MPQSLLEASTSILSGPHGSMLSPCPVPGCTKLTMGGTCVDHDEPVVTEFPRGRPYVARAETSDVTVAPAG